MRLGTDCVRALHDRSVCRFGVVERAYMDGGGARLSSAVRVHVRLCLSLARLKRVGSELFQTQCQD